MQYLTMTRDRGDSVLMSREDAAWALNMSVPTLDRIRKEGKIPYRQIGGFIRFTPQDIDYFISSAATQNNEIKEGENETAG